MTAATLLFKRTLVIDERDRATRDRETRERLLEVAARLFAERGF